MKNFFKAFLWFLLLALIALFLHYFLGEKLCGVCQRGTDKANMELVTEDPATSVVQKLAEFVITDADGGTLFKFPSNFIITANKGEVEIPESLIGIKDSVFNFLNKNQGKELLISAKYLESEGEPLGLNRANFLKNVLAESGINPNRIIPKAVLSDYSYDANSGYADGLAMLFRNASEETITAVDESISNKTLYAKFGSDEFKPDRSLQGYAFELKHYLEEYPDKKVSLTGHTDDVGEAAANLNLGLERANTVMNYLVSQGIQADKMKAYSKGETEPIESNETEEGRAKNRRILITVK